MRNKINYIYLFTLLSNSEKQFILENLRSGRIVRDDEGATLELFSPTAIHIAKGIINSATEKGAWLHLESCDNKKTIVRFDKTALSISLTQLWGTYNSQKAQKIKSPHYKSKVKKTKFTPLELISTTITTYEGLKECEKELVRMVIKKTRLDESEIKTVVSSNALREVARSLREVSSHDTPWILETEEFRGGMVIIWDKVILTFLKQHFALKGNVLG